MKKELSSVDLMYIVKEFQSVVNSKLDKIYQPAKKDLVLQIHVANKGKTLLRITPSFMFISSKKPVMPEKVLGFCTVLRKYLENSRIKSITQVDSERIVEILFERKEENLKLMIELFGGGNIILCDSAGKIMYAAENKKLKDREIRGGVKYKAPSRGIEPEKITKEKLAGIIKKSSDNISKTLATGLGIGGVYARELCVLSGIEEKDKKLDNKKIGIIHKNLKNIFNQKPTPQAVMDKDEVMDITPFKLESYSSYKSKSYQTLSSAIESSVSFEIPKKKSKFEKEITRLEKSISAQKKKIKQREKISTEERAKGEFIYEKYQLVKEVLDEIKKAREKYSWKDIKEKLKGHKLVKEVDGKTGKILLEL